MGRHRHSSLAMDGGSKAEKCRLGPQALTRLQRELRMLEREPPPGVSAWPKDENRIDAIEAVIQSPPDTVYEAGFFRLNVTVPSRYPFEPPSVQFSTPIYHPNIDSCGRICLDTLNMPPKGAWKPSLNIPTVLSTIRLLLEHPNPDDGLMTDITHEYKHRREVFDAKARESVRAHATSRDGGSSGSKPAAIDEAAPSSRQDPKEEEAVEPASALDSDGGQGKRK